jgi:hypothetical protein
MAKDGNKESKKTDLRIGIADTGVDLVYEIEGSVEDVVAKIEAAINDAKTLSLTDTKGRQILVPASKIAFTEVGNASDRKVGFTTL